MKPRATLHQATEFELVDQLQKRFGWSFFWLPKNKRKTTAFDMAEGKVIPYLDMGAHMPADNEIAEGFLKVMPK